MIEIVVNIVLAFGLAYFISEWRWREALTPLGRVIVPAALAIASLLLVIILHGVRDLIHGGQ